MKITNLTTSDERMGKEMMVLIFTKPIASLMNIEIIRRWVCKIIARE